MNGGRILLQGVSVSPGTTTGTVKIISSPASAEAVGSANVVVVRDSSPAFAVAVMNSAGLICERGGALSHICIVAMEMGIPCIAGAAGATKILEEASVVTLNATEGLVYEMDTGSLVRPA